MILFEIMKTKYQINPLFQNIYPFIADLPELFKKNDQTIHQARNELKIIPLADVISVVKSFKVPHLFNRIIYTFFRNTKASKSYQNALRLSTLNISTPTPIAYVEFFSVELLSNSYFVSLHVPYDFTIREALHQKIDDYEAVLTSFSAYTYDLHQKGVWHLDYSPGNILITKIENGYRFSIVDINRMEFREITPLQGCENFNKLWARDEHIDIMAHEYARLSGLDVSIAISEMKRHNDANKRFKNFKKRLKRVLKGDFSTPA